MILQRVRMAGSWLGGCFKIFEHCHCSTLIFRRTLSLSLLPCVEGSREPCLLGYFLWRCVEPEYTGSWKRKSISSSQVQFRLQIFEWQQAGCLMSCPCCNWCIAHSGKVSHITSKSTSHVSFAYPLSFVPCDFLVRALHGLRGRLCFRITAEVVGLMMDRCVAQVIAVFGTLKAWLVCQRYDTCGSTCRCDGKWTKWMVVCGRHSAVLPIPISCRLVQPSSPLTMLLPQSSVFPNRCFWNLWHSWNTLETMTQLQVFPPIFAIDAQICYRLCRITWFSASRMPPWHGSSSYCTRVKQLHWSQFQAAELSFTWWDWGTVMWFKFCVLFLQEMRQHMMSPRRQGQCECRSAGMSTPKSKAGKNKFLNLSFHIICIGFRWSIIWFHISRRLFFAVWNVTSLPKERIFARWVAIFSPYQPMVEQL